MVELPHFPKCTRRLTIRSFAAIGEGDRDANATLRLEKSKGRSIPKSVIHMIFEGKINTILHYYGAL